jgi:hypothetical protein
LKTQNDRDLLAKKLDEAQNLKAPEAYELAVEITNADPDIADAALSWCRTGVMPKNPEIEGWNPASLDTVYFPSQTFTLLIMLRRDGENTLRRMAHFPGRDARPDTFY